MSHAVPSRKKSREHGSKRNARGKLGELSNYIQIKREEALAIQGYPYQGYILRIYSNHHLYVLLYIKW